MSLASALAAAASFNLVCIGTMETTDAAGKREQPYRVEYRVDLDARLWCQDECNETFNVITSDETDLVLQYGPYRHAGRDSITMNRQSGYHLALRTDAGPNGAVWKKWEGRCEPAPFTPIPQRREF